MRRPAKVVLPSTTEFPMTIVLWSYLDGLAIGCDEAKLHS